jgi:phosphate transport system protein
MNRSRLDKELEELDLKVRRLGSLVDEALAQALEVLETADQDKAGTVVASDDTIDELYVALEKQTFRALILQQPLAGRDLRYLTSLLPIGIDLERIGDEAEGIAQIVLRMMPFRNEPLQQREAETNPVAPGGADDQPTEATILRSILDLGQHARSLLQRTMKAFAERDAARARSLWEEDKLVDRQGARARRDLIAMLEGIQAVSALQQDTHILQRATYLLLIAYKLERAADHCTNICERIVFLIEGETSMQPLLEQ